MREIIRTLSAQDVKALASLHFDCFGQEAWSANQLQGSLTLPTTFALGACVDGCLCGVLLVQSLEDSHEILTLAVHPNQRRTGLARKLVQTYQKQKAPQGRLFLEVAADNIPAIAFYESLGFAAIGRRSGYYKRAAQSIDALNYCLILDS